MNQSDVSGNPTEYFAPKSMVENILRERDEWLAKEARKTVRLVNSEKELTH